MRRPDLRLLALCAAVLTLGAASYGTVSIKLPPETVGFKPGPGADAATAHCLACHSAAYIYTQPALTRAQWTAEVKKMQGAYGAPIADADINAIVDYLMTQNGKS
jgi:sulfite dehydrogenase (cytochrome) subunit B